jgi:hypothetical protein
MSVSGRHGASPGTRAARAPEARRWAGDGRRVSLLALAAYASLSAVVYGRGALGDISHVVEGFGQSPRFYGHDQSIYVWSLAWAARSLTHGTSLFLTNAVFTPVGYNLAWATSLPGPALLIAPVTLAFGAVTSYNLLALAAPATAAWTAFLLCRQLTGRAPAAFAGGLLFGFGTYESAEMVNHLTLALVALLPLAALLVLRRHAGLSTRRSFIVALALVLALQLWTASEVLASMVGFGVVAFVIGALLAGRARRPAVLRTAAEALGAVALACLLALPFLYYAARYPNPANSVNGAEIGTDVANFLVPTRVTWLHGVGVGGTAAAFRGNITEQLGYVGLPLLVVLGCWAVEFRRSVLARCLLAFLLAAAVASLGVHAHVNGRASGVPLPWSLVSQLPLLGFAIPARFVVYAWLAAALAVSCWLARPSRAPLRWAAFALVVVSLAPNLPGVPWGTRIDAPPLLGEKAQLARFVRDGDTVLALPFGISGNSMFWQVEAGFRMRLAGGYLAVALPNAYRPYKKLLTALRGGPYNRQIADTLCSFVAFTGTRVVLLRDGGPPRLHHLLDVLGVRAQQAGGFSIYELTPSASPAGSGACG